jgi:hypothetical protein
MAAEGRRVLGGAGVALEPDAGLVARVAELAAAKYGQVAYNERR